MQARSGEIIPKRCAYCGEPLPFNMLGVDAWRVENQFFCNEFCAEDIQDEPKSLEQCNSRRFHDL